MKMRKLKLLSLVLAATALFTSVGVGHASWNFSASDSTSKSAPIAIHSNFNFRASWEGSDLLDDDKFELFYDEFRDTLNGTSDRSTEEATAAAERNFHLLKAFKMRQSRKAGHDYVGNMDNHLANELKQIKLAVSVQAPEYYLITFDDYSNPTEVTLYYTQKNLYDLKYSAAGMTPRPNTYVGPIYKTTYKIDSKTGKFEPVLTQVGYCKINSYSSAEPQTSFNTDTFVATKTPEEADK